MSNLANRLKEARDKAGLSQAALAKLIDAGQSTIASIENGRNQGSGRIVDLARVLNVRPEWLASGELPMRDGEAKDEAGGAPAKPSPWPFPSTPLEVIMALSPTERARLDGVFAGIVRTLDFGKKFPALPEQPRGSVARDDVDLPFGMQPLVAPPVPRPTVAPPSDVDLPFAPAPREVMPWEAHRFPQAPAPVPLISRERDVVANVSAGEHASNDEFEPVPELADVKLAAGEDGNEILNEAQSGTVLFRSSFLRKHAADNGRARVVYADGDSMEPVIRDGAALLLVPASGLTLRDVANSGVWAINYGGKMLVKTITRPRGGMWVARSYNATYPDILLETDVDVQVIGQVIWAGAELPTRDGEQWVRR